MDLVDFHMRPQRQSCLFEPHFGQQADIAFLGEGDQWLIIELRPGDVIIAGKIMMGDTKTISWS